MTTASKAKDKRITYNNEPIEVNGTVVRFDGKLNPETKELKIYRYYGDVNLRDEAIQNFAIDNSIATVVILTP